MRKTVLGCIADGFTGATDLANNLVRAGMRVVQTIGVPDAVLSEEADAIVVALKSRTIAPAEAVAGPAGAATAGPTGRERPAGLMRHGQQDDRVTPDHLRGYACRRPSSGFGAAHAQHPRSSAHTSKPSAASRS
jgi:hypothetical protein